MAKNKLLSLTEVAEMLNLSRQRVHQLFEEGRIEAQWVGLMLVFAESDVKEFKKAKRPPGRPPKKDG